MSSIFLFVRSFFSPRSAVSFSTSCATITMFKPNLLRACAFHASNMLKSTASMFPRNRNYLIWSYNGHRLIYTTRNCYEREYKDFTPSEKELAPRQNFFRELKLKDKATFLLAIETYCSSDKVKRGHIEFIYAALKCMPEFGVEGDLEVYKKIMDIFPKGRMIAETMIQAEFLHYPRHQDCALFVLSQMEEHGVIPDEEMKELIVNIFGKSSHVFKQYGRILYWGRKLKNISPFVLPDPLPSDAEKLAHLALKRMSVDLQSQIMHYKAEDLDDSLDNTWIVGSQSPDQMKLIEQHPVDQPLFVEGSFLIWLKRISISYFILRAAPKASPKPEVEVDLDDVSNLSLHMFGLPKPPDELVVAPSTVHEQEDGTILAMCATGTSSKDSLLSWIRFLQRTNPKLSEIPVLFTLRSPPTAVTTVNIQPENFSHDTEASLEQEVQKKAAQE